MTRAVVFGYGDVGVRGLATLLAHDIVVPVVVTHEPDANERQWQRSLLRYARERDIATLTVESPDPAYLLERLGGVAPDFVFSFYYRRMLSPAILALASRGALNLHGSLLPKFRGRAPINWAILQGERQTGVTLHYMTAKPDAGDIVAQRAFPILRDDTALDVFRKVCALTEITLHEALPSLLAGTAPRVPQDLAAGSYCRGRTPEDGRIDWRCRAQQIHDLVRAVAPPYPGALTRWAGRPARILRTLAAPGIVTDFDEPTAFARAGRCYVQCGDRRVLRLLEIEIDGAVVPSEKLAAELSLQPLPLTELTSV